MLLRRCFYTRSDVVAISRELLGKHLFTQHVGIVTGGIITETEAYAGEEDRASHAWNGRRTPRTEVMYTEGGCAYVYLCYGIHSLFNVVTNRTGIPHAVLIRAILPTHGPETMLERLGKTAWSDKLTTGPGRVTRALHIHFSQTGTDLTRKPSGDTSGIWIEDLHPDLSAFRLKVTPRIGVDYAGPDAALPYRFLLLQKERGAPF